MGTPMEGFFVEADIMAEAIAITPATAQGAFAEPLFPLHRPSPIKQSAQTERVGEFTSIPVEAPTSQKGVAHADASQTRSTSPTTPLVISASNPFAAFSQSIKDGSSLVITPSFIPNSTTCGPNADLSSDEGFEEVLKDDEDEPIVKKKVSNFDEDDGGEHETEAMSMCLLPLLDLLFSLINFFFT